MPWGSSASIVERLVRKNKHRSVCLIVLDVTHRLYDNGSAVQAVVAAHRLLHSIEVIVALGVRECSLSTRSASIRTVQIVAFA